MRSDAFEREARTIAALNHPHICTLHDIGADYLVMEHIEGVPLGGPLDVDEGVRLALQIVAALEAAHGKGIVHRDLKPANVLVTGGRVKLLDFGIAKLRRAAAAGATMTLSGEIAGTPAYMSPEQAQGQETDARSDIFSFGAVLYEMLAGTTRLRGDCDGGRRSSSAVLRDDPPPARVAGRALDRIVATLPRQVDLTQRFQRPWRAARSSSTASKASLSNDSPAAPSAVDRRAAVRQSSVQDRENRITSADGLAEEIINALAQVDGHTR